MSGKSDYLENLILDLIFKATTDATLASAAGSATNLYVALHTADPYAVDETATQTTSECDYTGYARVAVARSGSGWTRTGNSISPAANITFGTCSAGTNVATHVSVGTAASGAGAILYAGAITPSMSISTGLTPSLTPASTITEG